MRVREDRVDELKAWKEKVDEIASPSQLKELVSEVQQLKSFKIKAITIFTVVQFGMGAALWFMRVLGG
jgi:hypothetical protein